MAQTKRQARDHWILSDIYGNTVIERLGQVTAEVQRIYRRVCHHLLNFKNKAIRRTCSENTIPAGNRRMHERTASRLYSR